MCYIVYRIDTVVKTACFDSFERAQQWLERMEAKLANHSPVLPC